MALRARFLDRMIERLSEATVLAIFGRRLLRWNFVDEEPEERGYEVRPKD
jgi:hypothetical protein